MKYQFSENEFPSIEEVDNDFQFYELKNPNEIITLTFMLILIPALQGLPL